MLRQDVKRPCHNPKQLTIWRDQTLEVVGAAPPCMMSVLGIEEVTSKHGTGKLGAVLTAGSQNSL